MKKTIIRAGMKYLTSPDYRFWLQAGLGFFDKMADEEFLRRGFKASMGESLHLDSPQTFNEKLQWLKLYDRRPEYTQMVDKYRVREYVSNRIGETCLVPLLGVWDDPDEIDFDRLPRQFVLKCNHNSGLGMCICRDSSRLDRPKVRQQLRKGLRQDYFLHGREWPYKNVPRKIIAEQFLQSDAGGLTDYKVHCFGGRPRLILVCRDRFAETGLTEDFFSENWEHLALRRPDHPNAEQPLPKPDELPRMLELAKKLSENIPFVRADFYIVKGHIYFSELTFFPASGFERFIPEQWDTILGDWLTLPE